MKRLTWVGVIALLLTPLIGEADCGKIVIVICPNGVPPQWMMNNNAIIPPQRPNPNPPEEPDTDPCELPPTDGNGDGGPETARPTPVTAKNSSPRSATPPADWDCLKSRSNSV